MPRISLVASLTLAAALSLAAATPVLFTPSGEEFCETLGCRVLAGANYSTSRFTVSYDPPNGHGACECNGPDCEQETPCNDTIDFEIEPANGGFMCKDGTIVSPVPYNAYVSVDGCNDSKNVTINLYANNNCTGFQDFALLWVSCISCESYACPGPPM